MEPLEGKMTGTSGPVSISTKQQRIAELARLMPEKAMTLLSHHMDLDWMKEAYRRTRKDGAVGIKGPGSFAFLGFTHHWAKLLKGHWIIKRKTANSRFTKAVKRIKEWCMKNRHMPVAEQWKVLTQKLKGHYGYYGITGNSRCLGMFLNEVKTLWHKWLSRRSQKAMLDWTAFQRLYKRYPLPWPRIVHSIYRKAANP